MDINREDFMDVRFGVVSYLLDVHKISNVPKRYPMDFLVGARTNFKINRTKIYKETEIFLLFSSAYLLISACCLLACNNLISKS